MADRNKIKKTTSVDLLPNYFKTDANKKFLQATVDQLIQPGTVKKINGYIGRQNSKSTTGTDIFVDAPTATRQNYQLEPGLVVKDSLDNTTFFKDYQDYINQLEVFGGNTSNHARLNEQEFYSWDPHINWDKFVNFQNYYWLPYGPDVIKVMGQQQNITSSYQVVIVPDAGTNTYVFYPDGVTKNPLIKLYRGQTYRFLISSVGNPFSIKTKRTLGAFDRYQDPSVSNQGVENGVIEFTVPINSPDILYYVSETNIDLGGIFQISSIEDNTFINVDTDIIGKKSYVLPNGIPLSNGMKLEFVGNVLPEKYNTSQYYVEGVGTSIQLIDQRTLELVSSYTVSESVLFDNTPFDSMPWSDATSFPRTSDYIVINRSSNDHNPWSRYNRWFHRDVIETSASYNNKVADIDQLTRAVRPIIEFDANLRLFNFGTVAVDDVDLVDSFTTDVFSKIEGQLGYSVDGIQLAQGQRILFTADTDSLVKNKIYKVTFLLLDGIRQIHLIEDGILIKDQVVLVQQGVKNQGLMYWYDGSSWQVAQQKTSLNQAPLFDIADSNGVSYGDKSVYDGSTFTGTKLFSYKTRETPAEQRGDKPFSLKVGADATLGFPLSFRNIENIGDIVFNFNIATDSFMYKDGSTIKEKETRVGYLIKTESNVTSYLNGWQKSSVKTIQAAVRIYKNANLTNNFDLDIFDEINNLDDLVLKVYINGNRIESNKWTVLDGGYYKKIVLDTDIALTDILTIKAYAKQPINSNGFYEVPINLQNNPFNDDIGDFTLGEVIDHVGSIVENTPGFFGEFPGANNLRDLGNTTPYGTRFVQHSGPLSLSLYHVTSDTNNIIRAIEFAREEYNKFKRNFIAVAESLGVDTDTVKQVDLILQEINQDKPATFPFFFSDMIPYAGALRSDLTVIDYRIKTYPMSSTFDASILSTKSVLVYLNGTQLLYKKDYTFSDQGFVVVSATIANGDQITIYEYDNTNGCFVPPTPTKLGLWPKYEPKLYLDTALVTPRTMIQGHDGSQVLAYGDYRDDLILELEKRIFNNIKVEYDADIFDIHDIIPGYSRDTEYSYTEFNEVLAPNFYKWTNLVDVDFTKTINYSQNDSLTFNYSEMSTPDGQSPLPGYWKGVYRWILDTDRPNLCPWEILGFSQEPSWWQNVYGPAPYTKDNLILWEDLSEGIVREPNKPLAVRKKFARPILKKYVPVDELGNILSPLTSGFSSGVITSGVSSDFVFGDVSPVESAWRRSSYYPFSMLITFVLLKPAKTLGCLIDRSRVVRNRAGQLIYKDTGVRISPDDIVLPNIYVSATNITTSGIINYITDYILSDNLKSYDQYLYDLQNLSVRLCHRIGSFSSKDKFNLLLDSKTPLSSGSVFIPQEDYDIILNTSSPIKKITYSAVVVTKLSDGYSIKGYSKTQPYFKYYPYINSGNLVNIGGISEGYITWTPGQQYAAGKNVVFGNRFYKVKVLHTASDQFESVYYQPLASLPVTGGREAYIRNAWEKTETITAPYGVKFRTVQEVVDFLLGYGEWLKDQGFVFDDFNPELNVVTNWETSAKEFLFWTTQNWSAGQDQWQDWTPNSEIPAGTIVRYVGDYYKALRNVEPSVSLNEDDFLKLDGLSTIGSSVISLSPAASKLTFSAPLSVVDDIRNPFNGYEIFKVDGTPIQPNFINNYRDDTAVSYVPVEDGVFGATFYLVQKEQVVILKNTTLFNDTIYNPQSGYRQERIRVSGYISDGWTGSFNIPGFLFDQATINDWEMWKDYALGDIVKFKQFYYTAKTFTPGTDTFNVTSWIKLDKKPTSQLLPNWTYKAEQFTDFYSLDSDNFDGDQQKVAQHLVGYQRRQYLSNIIKDDVSEFKFYQGMIVEKGTKNVLNKLFDVLSADGQESVDFYEEWALRVGQYGASQSFDAIEFIIDEAEVKNNPQGYELVSAIDSTISDFIVRKTPGDVYLKPNGYNNTPWPISSSISKYLRTPGYVRPNDAKFILREFNDLLNQDIKQFVVGDYVWIGFEGREWNIYRYTSVPVTVVNIEFDETAKQLTLFVDRAVSFKTDDIIGISQAEDFSGFFKVKSVNLNAIKLDAPLLSTNYKFVNKKSTVVGEFVSRRVKNLLSSDRVSTLAIDRADEIFKSEPVIEDLMWTDDTGNGKWASWKYAPVYSKTELINTAPQDALAYGKEILINYNGNIAFISNDLGEVLVYDKAGIVTPWLQRQTITPAFISKTTFGEASPTPPSLTGEVLAISPDSRWLALGVPNANNVSSKCKFVNGSSNWSAQGTYAVGDIVTLTGRPYVALQSSTSSLPKNPASNLAVWQEIPYIPVSGDVTSTNSSLLKQGVVSIYTKDENNIFTLVDTIISPLPTSGENFGSNLVFGNNTLIISAAGNSESRGKVYQLSFTKTDSVTVSYNPVGSVGTILVVTSTDGIVPGMTVTGVGFSSSQTVISVINDTRLQLSAVPDSEVSGILEFYKVGWKYNYDNGLLPDVLQAGSHFGKSTAISADSNVLVIAATGDNIAGKVFVYKLDTGTQTYEMLEEIESDVSKFGLGLAVSSTGEFIAISSILDDGEEIDQGSVTVYQNSELGYTLFQKLRNIDPERAAFFGTKVHFMNDSDTLVVYSQGADSRVNTKFDNGATTLDSGQTRISDLKEDSGRIDIYDRYNTRWIFSESLYNTSDASASYSNGLGVSSNQILVGAPYAIDQGKVSGKVYEYKKPAGSKSWSIVNRESDRVDLSKIKRAFLYNKSTNRLVSYLDVLDPTQGKIPGIADQEIRYKTFYDPATYSVGNSDVKVDNGMAWSTTQVGQLWWDLRTAKFYDSYDENLVYRNSTWNTLFLGASIDVYEWVETQLTPSEWNTLADTEEGIASGISGTSLYDDEIYSVVRQYDNVSKTFENTYYFWVKNKKTIPNTSNRNLSASDVAELIANPRGYGYKYLALTGPNSFSLVNINNLLDDKNIVLSVEYWTGPYVDKNIHSEWKIISNNLQTTIPSAVEKKWFDSLCGKDSAGRLVPDTSLPPKLKYGIEVRPRQGMFVNRFEALKQFIEQANRVLIKELITENKDITDLQIFEKEPSEITGLYDDIFDSDAELRFANIGTFTKPILEPVVVDGRIVSVSVLERGRGYLLAPYLTISGDGTGAVIKTIINNRGQITGVTILSGGEGYNQHSTVLAVRNYSVLVRSDSTSFNTWSIYAYEPLSLTWSRVQSQSYDVRNYWSYADWYAPGYNEFTAIDYSVGSFVELNVLDSQVNQIVKVRSTNLGTWVLLSKYAQSTSVDWTQSYKVIGQENGTIQFSSDLYKFNDTPYGFDSSLYDSGIFDNSASIELRVILTALKDKILTDTLRQTYLDLFFSSVRYAHSEQNYLDWIFKTSFVKAHHSVGELTQKVTYNNDNLDNFEDFINEVKPYRTKVREYVSAYSKVDTSQLATTDFDLPALFENKSIKPIETTVSNGLIIADNSKINEYPWKHWYDNVGFSIIAVPIANSGSGYVSEPTVKFVSNTGTGATARAFISNGKVTRIVLLTPGYGYLSAPSMLLEGGLGPNGTSAVAVAIIGNSVVRSTAIKIKFDRITQKYFNTNLNVEEEFAGNSLVSGSRLQFTLAWAPDIRIGKSVVKINGVEALRANYKLSIVKSSSKGYTSYLGSLTFNVAPTRGSVITVSYLKDWSLLNAADRIQHYYNPAIGELGKDLAQLMTGVDYGGVIVDGLGFEVNQGWGAVPYYSDKWDSFDATFEDYIVTVSADTHEFTLPYVPTQGTELNIYYSSKSTTSYLVDDGFTTIYNFNVNYVYPPTVSVVVTSEIDNSTNINVVGSSVIKVASVTGIKLGDIVTISPNVDKTLGLNTKVVSINSTTNEIRIDQILFKDIEDDTQVVFSRVLVDPTDCQINPNGTVFLNEPLVIGSTIEITSFFDPVRLDDPNYTELTSLYATLVDKEAELTIVSNNYNTLLDSKSLLETTLTELTTQLTQAQSQYNSLSRALQGLLPSNPVYSSIAGQITVLVTTTIPNLTAEVSSTNQEISIIDGQLSSELNEQTSLQSEVSALRAEYELIPRLENPSAIMQTIISDGVADSLVDPTYKTFSIPETFDVSNGDRFIWRKNTSDGSLKPQSSDYDTALSGGFDSDGRLGYSTATGLTAEDILVDGDGFVTPTSSPATEEIVPGQVVDAVAIKVYDRPNSGSANIRVDNYLADGETTDFLITQQPNTLTSTIVKFTSSQRDVVTGDVTSISEIQSRNIDYIIDYKTRQVRFNVAPAAGQYVSIFSFGFSGTNILDLDYFVADGSTSEFITKAPWVTPVNYLIYIDGLPAEVVTPGATPALFKTDDSYDSANRIGINFSIPPSAGSIINYVIVSGSDQSYAITNTERIQGNGSNVYSLSYQVGNSVPQESNMLVRVNQQFLKGPNNSYFKVKGNQFNYRLDPAKVLPKSVEVSNIVVIADGNVLRSGIDYTVDIDGITIIINTLVRQTYVGKELIVSVIQGQEYVYLPPTSELGPRIQFAENYDSSQIIEVISSYKHDVLDIESTEVKITSTLSLTPDTSEYYNYRGLSKGRIVLDRPVISDDFVWVIKNGTLLTPSVDFKLNSDRQSIQLAQNPLEDDEVTITTFGSNVLEAGVSYMQFKDMLNRFHFKRLNANKRTRLLNGITFTSTEIEVEDASNFDQPSIINGKPGIIEIRGERIEYFTLRPKVVGDVTTYVFGQLRRGTLGTGVPSIHPAGSYVQDIGASETIPYVETTIVEQIKSDGTNIVPITFVPTKTTANWEYASDFVSGIPEGYSQADDIEVFVGGYASTPWAFEVSYKIDDVVEYGSYTYRCIAAHTSTKSTVNGIEKTFFSDSANWSFFVGNIRLKKKPYYVHNVNNSADSPEGDIQLDAEFAVDGESNQLRLTNKLAFGTRVTVVQRKGQDWDGKLTPSIVDTDSKISRFLKAEPGIWYANIGKYENKTGVPATLDSINANFDTTNITFDRG